MIIRILICVFLCCIANLSWARYCDPFFKKGHPQRFVKFQNHVLDRGTKLIWRACPVGYKYLDGQCNRTEATAEYFTWAEAQTYLAREEVKNQHWFLPSFKNTRSVAHFKCRSPSFDPAFFPMSDLPRLYFWLSTPANRTFSFFRPIEAYASIFGGDRSAQYEDLKTHKYRLWLVRKINNS